MSENFSPDTSVSYYGSNVKIWCPYEEDRDFYEIFHIANASMKILKNDWARISELMSEYPMIQVKRVEKHSCFEITARFDANINDKE